MSAADHSGADRAGADQYSHVPVLRDRVLDLLEPVAGLSDREPVFVDGTLGLGGHTEAMLQRFDRVHVIGIDRDQDALDRAKQRLAPFGDRVQFVHAIYDDIEQAVLGLGYAKIDGALFDLGVSSMQLDATERGFAYSQDAPLDMRMNPQKGRSAADVLNTYSGKELARILRTYGEEKFASRIADAIVDARKATPFRTSAPLVDLIRACIPAPARRTGGHPAKRTFQALRIEVNDELGAWERALPASLELLSPGGRVIVLSYHSLEDRITKRAMAKVTRIDIPRGLPVVPDEHAPKFELLTRGAEQASADEIASNPRARSVRMRAIERIAA